eukprot:9424132-Prorocentrum_lima.AAC.1
MVLLFLPPSSAVELETFAQIPSCRVKLYLDFQTFLLELQQLVLKSLGNFLTCHWNTRDSGNTCPEGCPLLL